LNEIDRLFAIYVHIPFCKKRCPYCDFCSRTKNEDEIESFLESVVSEIRQSPYRGSYASTLFLGGGTPSILRPFQLARIIDALEDCFCFPKVPLTVDLTRRITPEWTIECNPGTLIPETVDYLIQRGFNRFSLGVQSFFDSNLRLIGRIHSVGDTLNSFALLRNKGVSNINLDLIFSLPGQTLVQWKNDLNRAIDLKPEHLSIYGLTIEPGTEFGRLNQLGQISLPEEEIEAQMYETTLDQLASAGYQQYEISNFALPGFECRHNLAYWTNCEYLGFGPSAASYVESSRWTNTSDWNIYRMSSKRGKVTHASQEKLSGLEAFTDELLIRLRLTEGVDISELLLRHNITRVSRFHIRLEELKNQSLLKETATGRFCLTKRGKLLTSEVSVRLMQAIES